MHFAPKFFNFKFLNNYLLLFHVIKILLLKKNTI